MKLYTEEQVKKAIDLAGEYYDGFVYTEEEIFESLTPIELPSDVEVGKIVLGNYPLMEHRDSGYFVLGAMQYNKWLKEQILKQNNK